MRLSRIWRILQIKEGVSASVDNTLRDLQNSSCPTKAEFNNCFIIHSKYFPVLNGVSPFRSLLFCSPNSQSRPQVFSVNGWIICSGLHFWRHFDVNGWIICSGLHFWRHWLNMTKILCKFGEQQLVMVNYACGFNQFETGKYFEWIINRGYYTVARRYEFYFRVAKQYFTNERSEWVKYCFCHEKIKFISFKPPCNVLFII